jgi:hypothetical protein
MTEQIGTEHVSFASSPDPEGELADPGPPGLSTITRHAGSDSWHRVRRSLGDSAWWAGTADFAFKLTAVAAALVALQLFQGTPNPSIAISPSGQNANPGGGNPHMAMTLSGFDVDIQAGTAADVRNIVVIPIGGYQASPAGSDHLSVLPAGQSRTVSFVPVPGQTPLVFDDRFAVPFAEVNYDRTPQLNQPLFAMALMLLGGLLLAGLLVSLLTGKPLLGR